MSQRSAILSAIEEELKLLDENCDAMDKAEGSGVQSRAVKQEPKPSGSEKKKGFKLSGGGQSVGGDAGGVSESVVSEEDAIEKADGKSVASASPKEINGRDANGAPSAGGAEEGGNSTAVDRAKGSSVTSSKPKKSDGTSGGGGSNAKAVDKAKGKAVAAPSTQEDGLDNDGVKENKIIELPHDVMVEDSDGNIKTLKKGTKVVIGEDGMAMEYGEGDAGQGYEAGMDYEEEGCIAEPEPEVSSIEPVAPAVPAPAPVATDDAQIARIVAAVVQALNGGGEYDYAMEGKEIQAEALLEDVKKLLEGKPWETDDKEEEEEEVEEECVEDVDKKFGKLDEDLDNLDFGGEEEGAEGDEGDADDLSGIEGEEVDESSPDYIAALIDDVEDDLANLRGALGVGGDEDEDGELEDEGLEMADDEELGDKEMGDELGDEEEEEADISSLF